MNQVEMSLATACKVNSTIIINVNKKDSLGANSSIVMKDLITFKQQKQICQGYLVLTFRVYFFVFCVKNLTASSQQHKLMLKEESIFKDICLCVI